ncbi:hypothetical protein Ahy_B08g093090 isoform A [Arachis hypogaea]|uniref:protein-serine/threonine phosphatase n=1 Tax=Arachis hypogaea TaxID=3818 RepID=A0A444Y5B1_ARAHY|nr:hypothetical protein Ahy_B08g093090 isoform A [Arachis hypogaea]
MRPCRCVSPSEKEERELELCKGGAERAQGRSHRCRRILPLLPLLRSPSSSSPQAESPPSMVEPRRESARREETDRGGVRREEGDDVYVIAAKSHHRRWSLWPSGQPFLPPLMKLIGVARRLLSLYLVMLEAALLWVWLLKTAAGTPVFLVGRLDVMMVDTGSVLRSVGSLVNMMPEKDDDGRFASGGWKIWWSFCLFGIFDGHGSSHAIDETYQGTDSQFLDSEKDTFRDDGSTASTVVLIDNHLYVTNVGDSGTIILKAGKAIALSGSCYK